MAVYLDEFKRNSSNLEAKVQSKQFALSYCSKGGPGRRPATQGDTAFAGGDVVVIGNIPGGSVITKVTVLLGTAFDATVTATLSFTADYPALNLLEPLLQSDVLLDIGDNISLQPYLSNVGNNNPDGTALPSGDPRASVWLGDVDKTGDYYISATFGGVADGTVLTKGEAKVIVEYSRFATNEGAY
jgi:hypothetical protein